MTTDPFYKKYKFQRSQMVFQNKNKDVIPFNITFEDWKQIWLDSGHWEERGRLSHQYSLSRLDSSKPLTKDNGEVTLNSARVRKINKGRKLSDETKELMRQRKLGVPKSEQHKRNMSMASIAAHMRKGHKMRKTFPE